MKNAKLSLLAFVAVAALSAMPDTAHAAVHSCDVVEAGEVIGSRVYVKCALPISLNGQNVVYVALSSTSAAAARFLAVGQSAVLSGRTLRVDLPTTNGGGLAGCLAADCRTPTLFFLQK